MKIIKDSWGTTVLIGLRQTTLGVFSPDPGDDVVVAFDPGALSPAGAVGFLWDCGNAPDSGPPQSNSASIKSKLAAVHHLRRLNLG